MVILDFSPTASDVFLLGICGALLVIIIRFRFLSEIRNRDIFNKAADEFVASFHRELKEVYPASVNWPDNIDYFFKTKFCSLQEAVSKFRRHVPKRKRKLFDDAWFSFYCCTGREVDKNSQCYHHYMSFSGVTVVNGKEIIHDNSKTYKDNFKKNVNLLLKFAEHK